MKKIALAIALLIVSSIHSAQSCCFEATIVTAGGKITIINDRGFFRVYCDDRRVCCHCGGDPVTVCSIGGYLTALCAQHQHQGEKEFPVSDELPILSHRSNKNSPHRNFHPTNKE